MLPKVEGPWDIYYLDQLLAQLEARHGVKKPILIHAILETAEGVKNVEDDRARLAAHAWHESRPGGPRRLARDEDHPRRRRPSGIQGAGRSGRRSAAPRAIYQQDLWHYTVAKMVDACASAGIKSFYGPFGDIADHAACEVQFRNAFLMGCAGAWSLHPNQIALAKKVFSPDPKEVAFAKKILEAMPDGSGVAMIDGKMQDDATWKQAKVMVDLARQVAAKDPEYAALYGF